MNEEPIGFRFTQIHIVSKNMATIPFTEPQSSYNFDIKVAFKVNADHALVMPHVYINIQKNDKSETLASFEVAYVFEIIDFENVIKLNENNLYDIPKQLEDTIKPVCISTTRGIIFSELRGTYLHNAILPVVYMDSFDVIANLEEHSTEEEKDGVL